MGRPFICKSVGRVGFGEGYQQRLVKSQFWCCGSLPSPVRTSHHQRVPVVHGIFTERRRFAWANGHADAVPAVPALNLLRICEQIRRPHGDAPRFVMAMRTGQQSHHSATRFPILERDVWRILLEGWIWPLKQRVRPPFPPPPLRCGIPYWPEFKDPKLPSSHCMLASAKTGKETLLLPDSHFRKHQAL